MSALEVCCELRDDRRNEVGVYCTLAHVACGRRARAIGVCEAMDHPCLDAAAVHVPAAVRAMNSTAHSVRVRPIVLVVMLRLAFAAADYAAVRRIHATCTMKLFAEGN